MWLSYPGLVVTDYSVPATSWSRCTSKLSSACDCMRLNSWCDAGTRPWIDYIPSSYQYLAVQLHNPVLSSFFALLNCCGNEICRKMATPLAWDRKESGNLFWFWITIYDWRENRLPVWTRQHTTGCQEILIESQGHRLYCRETVYSCVAVVLIQSLTGCQDQRVLFPSLYPVCYLGHRSWFNGVSNNVFLNREPQFSMAYKFTRLVSS